MPLKPDCCAASTAVLLGQLASSSTWLNTMPEEEDEEPVHWDPHWPLPQPPKQPDELQEHGQFCGLLRLQQDCELQPPVELELDELEELLDEEPLIAPAEAVSVTLSSLAPSSRRTIRSV